MKRPPSPSKKVINPSPKPAEEFKEPAPAAPQQRLPLNKSPWLLGLVLFALVAFIFFSFRSTHPDSPIPLPEKSEISPEADWTQIGACNTNYYYVRAQKLHGLQANGRELFTCDLGEDAKVCYGKDLVILNPNFSIRLLDPQTGEVKNEVSAPQSLDLMSVSGGPASYAVFFQDKIRLYDSRLKVVEEILNLQSPYDLAIQAKGLAWLERGPVTKKDLRSEDEGTLLWDPGIAPLPDAWPNRSFLGLKEDKKLQGLPSQRPFLDLAPLGQEAFAALTHQNLLIIKNQKLVGNFSLHNPRSWDSGSIFVVLDGDQVRRFTEDGKELDLVSLTFQPQTVKVGKEASFAFGEGTCARIEEKVEEFPLKLHGKLPDPFLKTSGKLEVFTDQGLMNLDFARSSKGPFN